MSGTYLRSISGDTKSIFPFLKDISKSIISTIVTIRSIISLYLKKLPKVLHISKTVIIFHKPLLPFVFDINFLIVATMETIAENKYIRTILNLPLY